MPPEPDLTIRDVTISETTAFDRSGNFSRFTQVQYFVGTHGPFTLQYPLEQFTSAKARADMEAKAREIRAVVMGT